MNEARFEALVEQTAAELRESPDQISLFTFALAEEAGFDINDILRAAEASI
jgi:hypothetical protein